MDKRGVELSMNIIIIAILLILVLVVLATFFTGGFTKIASLFGQIAPDNLEVAVQNCQSRCQIAQTFTGDNAKEKSAYCSTTVSFDSDGDDIADERHHCWSNDLGVNCPGVQDKCVYDDTVEKIET